jgi:tripartite-type tricarboxylate transporter receptor subunit TctC
MSHRFASVIARRLAVTMVMLLAATVPSRAQDDWPQRRVTVVVPFAAGGSADMIGRLVAQHLEAKFGIPFVVENKGGAGGSLGAAYAAKAVNDGSTLFIGTVSTNAINPALYTSLPFDPERDFAPISLLVRLPNLLAVNNRIPAKTVPEVIAYLKANDGKVTYGSSGVGTSSHLSVVLFALATGTRMVHVPFRSTAEELTSMLGGNVDLAIDSMTTIWPQAQTGVVRAIAVTTPHRSASAPDLPTIGETLSGFEATGWQGLYAPSGTPDAIIRKVSAEVRKILEAPGVIATLKAAGAEPAPMRPEEFAAFTRAERAKWAEVVKTAGIHID